MNFINATDRNSGKSWTRYTNKKIKFLIGLESQHNECGIFNGPLSLEIILKCTRSAGKGDISTYVKFIEVMMRGIAYHSFSDIHKVIAQRQHVTAEPSTTIILAQMEKE
jgi:hypothetical protein